MFFLHIDKGSLLDLMSFSPVMHLDKVRIFSGALNSQICWKSDGPVVESDWNKSTVAALVALSKTQYMFSIL